MRLPLTGLIALALCACNDRPAPGAAPTASALAPAQKRSDSARAFDVESASSKVTFLMSAPIEKIYGDAPGSASGELFIDLSDILKTTGLIRIDLDKLVLYQQKREDEKAEFGERTKSDKQNEHARAWLEISPDAPADQRELNRWVEFRIDKVLETSAADVTRSTGAERTVTATVEGDLRVHQRKVKKQAKVQATFKYDGDRLASVTITTLAPVVVDLETHDVRPRELFGKLAQKTLSDLGQKVAKEAPVEIELTARPK